jgi:hypothetical protein
MRTAPRVVTALVVVVGLAGCTNGGRGAAGRPTVTVSPTPESVPSPGPRPSGCPVTVPTAVTPSANAPGDFFGARSAYGNGALWVGGLGDAGVIVGRSEFDEPDGAVYRKFGWWRGVEGTLRITGRRLDGPAPPARSSVPDGYGSSGFQASGVYFTTPGCWEVTGTVGAASLTFVTLVVKPA